MNSPPLILASGSVYRRTLLQRLGLPFEVCVADVDETPLPGEAPMRTAMRLAKLKARAAAGKSPNALVIGSDQVAVLDDHDLSKPGDHAAAVRQLTAMRGRNVVFHTALCLFNSASGRTQLANVPTTVRFRKLTDAQIEHYLRIERPYDCAGSAKIEGLGIALVERITAADPSALIGLPLIALTSMLKNEGIEVL